jgi:Phage integrase family
VDYESHAVALDRNELGALLVAAGLCPSCEHALISLLALNGLRVSEATGADIEQLGLERGHRTLTITRKGGKVVTIPLAPRTARAIDLAIAERTDGPVFLAADGRRLDRHGARRIVRKVARRAGIGKAVTPHTLRHASPPRSTRGSRCATCKRRPLMRIRGPRSGMTGPAAAWTGTPPTSWPPTSRAPPGNGKPAATAPPGSGSRRTELRSRCGGHTRRPQDEREPPICSAVASGKILNRAVQIGHFCVPASWLRAGFAGCRRSARAGCRWPGRPHMPGNGRLPAPPRARRFAPGV